MLTSLEIRHFALIEKISLNFSRGLSVITGESGSGKTTLIQALAELIADKPNPHYIRQGASSAQICVSFSLPNTHPVWNLLRTHEIVSESVEDGELLLKREIGRNRPSRCFINDERVSARSFVRVAELLFDFTGQFAQQQLLRISSHREMLDVFSSLEPLVEAFRSRYRERRTSILELKNLSEQHEEKKAARERSKEVYAHITSIAPKENEDKSLGDDIIRRENYQLLQNYWHTVQDGLFGDKNSIKGMLEHIADTCSSASEVDERWLPVQKHLRDLLLHLEPLQEELRSLRNDDSVREDDIDALNERLRAIQDLIRHYGEGSLSGVFQQMKKFEELLEDDSLSAEGLEHCKASCDKLRELLQYHGLQLTAARKHAGLLLQDKVTHHLKYLSMPASSFIVRLKYIEDPNSWYEYKNKMIRVDEGGVDFVEFLFSANAGEDPQPLARIASGGERSRVLLAIKSILHEKEASLNERVWIFDEVDSGVGGAVATHIGQLMQRMARDTQIISITHSPQVASYGTDHIVMHKTVLDDNRTTIQATSLESEESRVNELARMLSGENVHGPARENARALLSDAHAEDL